MGLKMFDNSSHFSFSEIHKFLSNDKLKNLIKICTWNVHSIKSFNAFVNFKHDISGIVRSKIDFILLTETWMDSNQKFDLHKIDNFNSIKCVRAIGSGTKSTGGGLVIYLKSCYIFKTLRTVCLPYIEFIITEISLEHSKFILVCIYRPWSRPPNTDFADFLLDFERILEFCGDNQVIIGGDFNVDILSNDFKSTQYKDLLALFNVTITNNGCWVISPKIISPNITIDYNPKKSNTLEVHKSRYIMYLD
jgi:exonuclease III